MNQLQNKWLTAAAGLLVVGLRYHEGGGGGHGGGSAGGCYAVWGEVSVDTNFRNLSCMVLIRVTSSVVSTRCRYRRGGKQLAVCGVSTAERRSCAVVPSRRVACRTRQNSTELDYPKMNQAQINISFSFYLLCAFLHKSVNSRFPFTATRHTRQDFICASK